MSTWVTLILAFVRMAASLTELARERRWLKAGEAQMLAELMRKQADDLSRAEQARADARARNGAVPHTSGLPDDGFRRD